MRTALQGIALTLASCAIAGAAVADETTRLHDEMRGRVLNAVSLDTVTAAALRNALRRDPEFERLL